MISDVVVGPYPKISTHIDVPCRWLLKPDRVSQRFKLAVPNLKLLLNIARHNKFLITNYPVHVPDSCWHNGLRCNRNTFWKNRPDHWWLGHLCSLCGQQFYTADQPGVYHRIRFPERRNRPTHYQGRSNGWSGSEKR